MNSQTTTQTKTEKGRAGAYRIFHVGKCAYTVEQEGVVLGQFKNLSQAWNYASEKHRAGANLAARA